MAVNWSNKNKSSEDPKIFCDYSDLTILRKCPGALHTHYYYYYSYYYYYYYSKKELVEIPLNTKYDIKPSTPPQGGVVFETYKKQSL